MAPTAGLVQRLKAAAGDPDRILELVQEAERCNESQQTLSEIYGVAVDVYGQARCEKDHALTDLCVKRMRLLCRLDPNEARQFHNRLRAFRETGFVDSRLYQARAVMEERAGDTAKAIKMLQEGLRLGAEPAEALQRALNKLQGESGKSPRAVDLPAPVSPAPAAGTRFQSATLTPVATAQAPPPLPAAAPVQAPPPLPAAAPAVGPAAVATAAEVHAAGQVGVPAAAPRPAPDPASVSASAAAARATSPAPGTLPDGGQRPSALEPCSTIQTPRRSPAPVLAPCRSAVSPAIGSAPRVPRILGLGPCNRNEAGVEQDYSDEDEGNEQEDENVERQESQNENLATTTMSTMPLSPIKEADSPEEATNETTEHSPHLNTPLPPPGSTAPRAIAAAAGDSTGGSVGQKTPHKIQDTSVDSNTVLAEVACHSSETGKASKTISVNGIPYTQLQTIGRGGSSKVYLVQTPDGEVVALKRVVEECAKNFEAFQNEVQLLQQLRHEQHVIKVLDAEVDRERGRIHIVMEAGDMDLSRFLQTVPRLSLTKVQSLWRQMLEAVQVIHSARIVHSDLKPGNFLLVRGQLKVIDFGIAKRISNDTTNISRDTSVGTLSYMAPEAVKHGAVKMGRSSDIWSLGIILYQLVYRTLPFQHLEPMQRLMMLNDPKLTLTFPSGHCLEDYSSSVQADLLEVLKGCLQRDPRRRLSLQALLTHPFLTKADEELEHQLQRAIDAEKRAAELQRLLEEQQARSAAAEQRALASQGRVGPAAEQQAHREAVEHVMSSLLAGMRRTVGDALQVPETMLQEYDWNALGEEVAQRIRNSDAGQVSSSEFVGLEPLKERLQRWTACTTRQPLLQRQAVSAPAAPCKASLFQNMRPIENFDEKENAPPLSCDVPAGRTKPGNGAPRLRGT